MEIPIYPSIEDIYDLSSADLSLVQRKLRQSLDSSNKQEQLNFLQLLQNIEIELQQRKTLQFFNDLCQHENPYLQQVTEFNKVFTKIAHQALLQKGEQEYQKDSKIEKVASEQEQSQQNEKQYYQTEKQQRDKIKSENDQILTVTTNSISQSSKSEFIVQQGKRMKIGGNRSKQSKNKMKQLMQKAMQKVQQHQYFILKGGRTKQKNIYSKYDSNGRHIGSSPTQINIQEINNKKKNNILSTNNYANPVYNSNKQILKAQQHQSQRNKIKKIDKNKIKMMDKYKSNKPQTRKNSGTNNKQLVEMVKKQQEQRQRRRRNQIHEEKQKQRNTDTLEQMINKDKKVSKNEQNLLQKKQLQENTIKILQNNKQQINKKQQQQIIQEKVEKQQIKIKEKQINIKKEQTSKQEVVIQEELNKITNEEQIQEEINSNKSDQNQELERIFTGQKYVVEETLIIHQEEVEQSRIDQKDLIAKLEQSNFENKEIISKQLQRGQNQLQRNKQLISIHKINDSCDQEVKIGDQNSEFQPILDHTAEKSNKIMNIKQKDQTENNQIQSKVNHRCYNEQYWQQIRQEAEIKIKKFKEEKQLLQWQKQRMNKNLQQKVQDKIEPQKHNKVDKSNQNGTNIIVKGQKSQLKKQLKPVNLIKKISHVIPEFNYLQVLPSFNHIFNLSYQKLIGQQQISNLMKEIIQLFTTHLNHYKNKCQLEFQSAIFLPFQNNFQLSNPQQLLLHTENTHINLKTILQRIEIFTHNLQGKQKCKENRYFRVIKTREQVYDIITTTFLRRMGWMQLPHGCSLKASWNLFWSWSKPEIDMNKLLIFQKINHFPFNKNIVRKDLLYRNLENFRKQYRISMPFLPLTYNLPKQFSAFSIKYHEQQITNKNQNYWIMKPIGKSRGRGIKIINSLSELNYIDNIVVQRYIANPLLLDGYKFDMRIYVLVTSVHPLEAFIYRQGFARFSTEKYSLAANQIKNSYIHLTNFSIQKHNTEAKNSEKFMNGSKISMKNLRDKINQKGYSFNTIWVKVCEIVTKSLLGCSVSIPSFPGAFQLFGYDIMIDSEGICHLIEVNSSPSLQRSYLIDEIIKQSLVDDIIDIIDPPNFDKEQLIQVFNQRLQFMSNGKTMTSQQDLIDLARILKYRPLRKVGEKPNKMGLFEMIAPCQLSLNIEKLMKNKTSANNPHNID